MFINTRAKLNQQVVFNLCSQRYILCYRLIKYSIIFESKATSRQSEENPHSAVNTTVTISQSVWETVTRSSHHQQKAQAGLRTFGDDLNCNPFITAFRTPCQPQSHVTKTAEITDSGALGNTHDTYRFAVGSLFDWDVISLFLSIRHVTLSRKKRKLSTPIHIKTKLWLLSWPERLGKSHKQQLSYVERPGKMGWIIILIYLNAAEIFNFLISWCDVLCLYRYYVFIFC